MPNIHIAATYVAYVSYICVASAHDRVLNFTLRPAVSSYRAFLRQVHQMTPK